MSPLVNSICLGFITSMTPCVLSANAAIVTYIDKKTDNRDSAIFYSILYIFGRMFFYSVLSFILSMFVTNVDFFANFLHSKANMIVGIILIFVGLMLLDIIRLNLNHGVLTEKIRKKTDVSKYFSTFIFGVLLAGMFCPVTASLFLAVFVESSEKMISSTIYGLFTGLPVFALYYLLYFGKTRLRKIYNNIDVFQRYSSKVSGVVFVLMGIGLIFRLF